MWKSGPIPCMNLLGEHFPLPEFFLPTPTITLIMVRPKSKEISRPTLGTGSSRRGNLEKISLWVSPSLNLKLSLFLCSRQRPQRSKSSDMTHGKRFLKWIAVTEQVIRYGSLWSEQNLSKNLSSPSCASISLANWFVHQEIYTTIYSIQLWEPRVKHMLI